MKVTYYNAKKGLTLLPEEMRLTALKNWFFSRLIMASVAYKLAKEFNLKWLGNGDEEATSKDKVL